MRMTEHFPRNPDFLMPEADARKWVFRTMPFSDYMADFAMVDHGRIEELLARGQERGSFTVIDLLAYPFAVEDMRLRIFPDLPDFRGLSVGRSEPELEEEIGRLRGAEGVSHMVSDLRHWSSWRDIRRWLGDRKADLIMERGYGGLHFIPHRESYYKAVMSHMWEMLSEGGILMLQVPPREVFDEYQININRWINTLRRRGIYRQYMPTYESRDILPYGLLMLQKEGMKKLPPLR